MHFSASSQWSKICFGYQGIIFNGENVLKFSQIEAVRLGRGWPPLPPQSGQPDRFFPVFFLNPSLRMAANGQRLLSTSGCGKIFTFLPVFKVWRHNFFFLHPLRGFPDICNKYQTRICFSSSCFCCCSVTVIHDCGQCASTLACIHWDY